MDLGLIGAIMSLAPGSRRVSGESVTMSMIRSKHVQLQERGPANTSDMAGQRRPDLPNTAQDGMPSPRGKLARTMRREPQGHRRACARAELTQLMTRRGLRDQYAVARPPARSAGANSARFAAVS